MKSERNSTNIVFSGVLANGEPYEAVLGKLQHPGLLHLMHLQTMSSCQLLGVVIF